MIDQDRWYTARDFSAFLGVHPVSIYQSQSHLGSHKLPLPLPVGIKIGRSVRWTGRQILDYQVALARMSGVELSCQPGDAPTPVAAFKKSGRPRKGAAQSQGAAA